MTKRRVLWIFGGYVNPAWVKCRILRQMPLNTFIIRLKNAFGNPCTFSDREILNEENQYEIFKLLLTLSTVFCLSIITSCQKKILVTGPPQQSQMANVVTPIVGWFRMSKRKRHDEWGTCLKLVCTSDDCDATELCDLRRVCSSRQRLRPFQPTGCVPSG